MAGAYTAKPEPGWEEKHVGFPDDWWTPGDPNPPWSFPGPSPPGYDPEYSFSASSVGSSVDYDGSINVEVILRDRVSYKTIDPQPSLIGFTATFRPYEYGAKEDVEIKFSGGEGYESAIFIAYSDQGSGWFGASPDIEFDLPETSTGIIEITVYDEINGILFSAEIDDITVTAAPVTITGRVTRDDGTSVTGAQVYFSGSYPYSYSDYAYTNSSGNYTFTGVPFASQYNRDDDDINLQISITDDSEPDIYQQGFDLDYSQTLQPGGTAAQGTFKLNPGFRVVATLTITADHETMQPADELAERGSLGVIYDLAAGVGAWVLNDNYGRLDYSGLQTLEWKWGVYPSWLNAGAQDGILGEITFEIAGSKVVQAFGQTQGYYASQVLESHSNWTNNTQIENYPIALTEFDWVIEIYRDLSLEATITKNITSEKTYGIGLEISGTYWWELSYVLNTEEWDGSLYRIDEDEDYTITDLTS